MLSCCSLGSGRYPEVSGLQCLRAVHAGESRAVLGWIWQFFFGILTGESVNRQSLRKKQRRSLCRSVALPFFLCIHIHIFSAIHLCWCIYYLQVHIYLPMCTIVYARLWLQRREAGWLQFAGVAWGVPPNHPVVIRLWLSVETHGDLGIPH